MSKSSKILAVAVVAMFAMTAFAVVASENDAANKSYHFYVEVLDEKGDVDAKGWSSFSCEKNNSAWAAQATNGFQDVMGMVLNDVRDYYVTGNDDGVRFVYDSTEYWPACFFNKDGKWALVSDVKNEYINADSVAVVMYSPDLYGEMFYAIELPVGADAKDYLFVEESWGSFYMKLPTASPNGYDSGNMTLYIVIGVIAVIIIIAAVYFVIRKKKTA